MELFPIQGCCPEQPLQLLLLPSHPTRSILALLLPHRVTPLAALSSGALLPGRLVILLFLSCEIAPWLAKLSGAVGQLRGFSFFRVKSNHPLCFGEGEVTNCGLPPRKLCSKGPTCCLPVPNTTGGRCKPQLMSVGAGQRRAGNCREASKGPTDQEDGVCCFSSEPTKRRKVISLSTEVRPAVALQGLTFIVFFPATHPTMLYPWLPMSYGLQQAE